MINDDYYQKNAQQFYEDTVSVDMSDLYQPFIANLKPGACILDAGCGSGRDTKAFIDMGYSVDAFDASNELVQRARLFSRNLVKVMRFQEIAAIEHYNGIWCCASLLHVPEKELIEVMALLTTALKPGGVWYMSFKYGSGERCKDGRHFTDMNETRLKNIIESFENLSILRVWKTDDQRPERNDTWLNALLQKDGDDSPDLG